jgi:hypothetical protein
MLKFIVLALVSSLFAINAPANWALCFLFVGCLTEWRLSMGKVKCPTCMIMLFFCCNLNAMMLGVGNKGALSARNTVRQIYTNTKPFFERQSKFFPPYEGYDGWSSDLKLDKYVFKCNTSKKRVDVYDVSGNAVKSFYYEYEPVRNENTIFEMETKEKRIKAVAREDGFISYINLDFEPESIVIIAGQFLVVNGRAFVVRGVYNLRDVVSKAAIVDSRNFEIIASFDGEIEKAKLLSENLFLSFGYKDSGLKVFNLATRSVTKHFEGSKTASPILVHGFIWAPVCQYEIGSLLKIDPETLEIIDQIKFPSFKPPRSPSNKLETSSAIQVGDYVLIGMKIAQEILVLDLERKEIVQRIPFSNEAYYDLELLGTDTIVSEHTLGTRYYTERMFLSIIELKPEE